MVSSVRVHPANSILFSTGAASLHDGFDFCFFARGGEAGVCLYGLWANLGFGVSAEAPPTPPTGSRHLDNSTLAMLGLAVELRTGIAPWISVTTA